MSVCDPVVVMAYGRVLAEGTAGRDPGQRRGARSLSRGRLMARLEIERRRRRLRHRPGHPDRALAEHRAGPQLLHHRPERRRQVDAAQGDLRPAAAAPRRGALRRRAPRRPARRPGAAPGHLLRAAGPQPVPRHDRPREPAHGRLHPARTAPRSTGASRRCRRCSRSSRERRSASRPRRCPAGSSSSCCSAGRWCCGRSIIMLDEPSLGLAPSVSRQIFDVDGAAEGAPASPSSSWSRTRGWASTSPIGAACSTSGGWCSRARRRRCSPTRASRSSTSAGGERADRG